jgi:hypothetical protein
MPYIFGVVVATLLGEHICSSAEKLLPDNKYAPGMCSIIAAELLKHCSSSVRVFLTNQINRYLVHRRRP